MTSVTKEVHVLVCGIGGSGKRSLCTRFALNAYSEIYDPTGDSSDCRKQHIVDSTAYLITTDTAINSISNSAVFQHQCRDANAFILLYSITSSESITALRSIHAALTEHQQTQTFSTKPTFLVGTKVDLEPQREVSLSDARSLAIELNCRKWFEVSAKEQTDEINDLFTKLVRETQRSQLEVQPTSTSSATTAVGAQSDSQSQATPQRTRTNGTTTSLTPSQKGALSPDSQTQSPPRSSSRGGSMLERFKFGSLKRKTSIQSLVRKQSGSFSASIMSSGDSRPSKEQQAVGGPGVGTKNGPPYRLDVDTSAWGSVKWPAEIIPE